MVDHQQRHVEPAQDVANSADWPIKIA